MSAMPGGGDRPEADLEHRGLADDRADRGPSGKTTELSPNLRAE